MENSDNKSELRKLLVTLIEEGESLASQNTFIIDAQMFSRSPHSLFSQNNSNLNTEITDDENIAQAAMGQ